MIHSWNRYRQEIKTVRWDDVTSRGEASLLHPSTSKHAAYEVGEEMNGRRTLTGRLSTDGRNTGPIQQPTEVISVMQEAKFMKTGMKTSYRKQQSFLNLRYLNKEKLQQ